MERSNLLKLMGIGSIALGVAICRGFNEVTPQTPPPPDPTKAPRKVEPTRLPTDTPQASETGPIEVYYPEFTPDKRTLEDIYKESVETDDFRRLCLTILVREDQQKLLGNVDNLLQDKKAKGKFIATFYPEVKGNEQINITDAYVNNLIKLMAESEFAPYAAMAAWAGPSLTIQTGKMKDLYPGYDEHDDFLACTGIKYEKVTNQVEFSMLIGNDTVYRTNHELANYLFHEFHHIWQKSVVFSKFSELSGGVELPENFLKCLLSTDRDIFMFSEAQVAWANYYRGKMVQLLLPPDSQWLNSDLSEFNKLFAKDPNGWYEKEWMDNFASPQLYPRGAK